MADQDDGYEQAIGTDTSEAAVEPGSPHVGEDDSRDPSDRFEADAPADAVRRVKIPRGEAYKRELAATIAKFKSEKTTDDPDEGDFGEYDERPERPAARPSTPAVNVETARSPEATAPPSPASPPAPSLDPEVTRLRQQLASDRETLAAKLAEADKARESVAGVVDHEQYLDSAPKAYRKWVESMRGAPMTDDEFRQEAADFVTLMSGDVLGVHLPDEVKSRIESQLTRKALSAYKANASRKEIAEQNKRETERVEKEWTDAATALTTNFRNPEVGKAYEWLAAEDDPGRLVIDVIRSKQKSEGTNLSWQEASKLANDWLKKQASGYIDKRKHLLSAAPADKVPGDVAPAKQEARPGRPPGTQQVTRAPDPVAPSTPQVVTRPKPGSTWDREAHRKETRRAFASVFKPED